MSVEVCEISLADLKVLDGPLNKVSVQSSVGREMPFGNFLITLQSFLRPYVTQPVNYCFHRNANIIYCPPKNKKKVPFGGADITSLLCLAKCIFVDVLKVRVSGMRRDCVSGCSLDTKYVTNDCTVNVNRHFNCFTGLSGLPCMYN